MGRPGSLVVYNKYHCIMASLILVGENTFVACQSPPYFLSLYCAILKKTNAPKNNVITNKNNQLQL